MGTWGPAPLGTLGDRQWGTCTGVLSLPSTCGAMLGALSGVPGTPSVGFAQARGACGCTEPDKHTVLPLTSPLPVLLHLGRGQQVPAWPALTTSRPVESGD